MIFVTLGTQKFQLNRLLQRLDSGIEEGLITDEIVAQIGCSDYIPRRFQSVAFLEKDAFEDYIKKADIVITHGGVGSVMTALQNQKPVIIFPRLAEYREHVDNHQSEIARAFAQKGYALLCGETDDLPRLIAAARDFTPVPYRSETGRIIQIIEDFLQQ